MHSLIANNSRMPHDGRQRHLKASPAAQDHFANGNNEWPAANSVKIANPALQAMSGGSFKSETIPVGVAGANQVKVQQMLETVSVSNNQLAVASSGLALPLFSGKG